MSKELGKAFVKGVKIGVAPALEAVINEDPRALLKLPKLIKEATKPEKVNLFLSPNARKALGKMTQAQKDAFFKDLRERQLETQRIKDEALKRLRGRGKMSGEGINEIIAGLIFKAGQQMLKFNKAFIGGCHSCPKSKGEGRKDRPLSNWNIAIKLARDELNIKGFQAIKKGTPLYNRAQEIKADLDKKKATMTGEGFDAFLRAIKSTFKVFGKPAVTTVTKGPIAGIKSAIDVPKTFMEEVRKERKRFQAERKQKGKGVKKCSRKKKC